MTPSASNPMKARNGFLILKGNLILQKNFARSSILRLDRLVIHTIEQTLASMHVKRKPLCFQIELKMLHVIRFNIINISCVHLMYHLLFYASWGCGGNPCPLRAYMLEDINTLHYIKHNEINVKSVYKFSLWKQKNKWLILIRETRTLNLGLREEDCNRQKPNGAHGYPSGGNSSLNINVEVKTI